MQKNLLDRGAPVREVDPAKLAAAFPPVGPVALALWHDGAARVDGRLLARWLREAAESRGAALCTERVQQLMLGDGRVSGVVLASGERVPADAVIVAAGAWTTALLDPVAPTLRIAPQRGQIMHLRVLKALGQSWPMVQGVRGHYLLPWPDGRVVAGASRETGSGFPPELTAGGEAEVLAEAVRVAPGLAAAPVMEWRVGLRPTSADGMPLLGALRAALGVHVLADHGADGLLVARCPPSRWWTACWNARPPSTCNRSAQTGRGPTHHWTWNPRTPDPARPADGGHVSPWPRASSHAPIKAGKPLSSTDLVGCCTPTPAKRPHARWGTFQRQAGASVRLGAGRRPKAARSGRERQTMARAAPWATIRTVADTIKGRMPQRAPTSPPASTAAIERAATAERTVTRCAPSARVGAPPE